jgi:hypothetical protein
LFHIVDVVVDVDVVGDVDVDGDGDVVEWGVQSRHR